MQFPHRMYRRSPRQALHTARGHHNPPAAAGPHMRPFHMTHQPQIEALGEFLISARSLAEYRAIFALTEADLNGRILDCPDGAASFTAQARALGAAVIAADPIYAQPSGQLRTLAPSETDRGNIWATAHSDHYRWGFYRPPRSRFPCCRPARTLPSIRRRNPPLPTRRPHRLPPRRSGRPPANRTARQGNSLHTPGNPYDFHHAATTALVLHSHPGGTDQT